MNKLTSGNRAAIYVAGNVCFLLATLVLGTSVDAPIGRIGYLIAMFVLCSAPILLLEELNGPYVLLALFMVVYFVFFAMLDLLTLLGREDIWSNTGPISLTEMGLLMGAALLLAGYCAGAKLGKAKQSSRVAGDWARTTIVLIGSALWLLGSASIVYYQVFVVPEKTNAATQHGLASLGGARTFVIMLGQLIEPLGVLILAYGYAKYRTLFWLLLILTVVVTQVAMGFICDIKSLGMLGGILVILAKTLVDNKLPKAWLLGGVLFLILVFPLFQAYRSEVTGQHGLTRTQAVENIGKVIDIVLTSRKKSSEGARVDHSASFFERASLKGNVELAVEHTGNDAPFQNGRTLVALFTAFIPRLVWPDKPDVAVGQEFNHVFIHGEFDTFISPSHFGELYWNFGWPGTFLGMTIIGGLMGFIGARCSLAQSQSVTRLLILLATAHSLCLGFEGSIAIAYVVWFRSLAAIALLHWLFARRSTARAGDSTAVADSRPDVPAANGLAKFSNVMP